jgi:hypothetical protein
MDREKAKRMKNYETPKHSAPWRMMRANVRQRGPFCRRKMFDYRKRRELSGHPCENMTIGPLLQSL